MFFPSKQMCSFILNENVSLFSKGQHSHGMALYYIICMKYLLCALYDLVECPHPIPMTSYVLIIKYLLSHYNQLNDDLGLEVRGKRFSVVKEIKISTQIIALQRKM